MIYAIIIIAALAAAFGVWLFMVKPNCGRRERMKPFEERYIAHRGLFDNGGPAPENSLPAFRRAVEAGYGIELDVQRTSDGKLVVFHDSTLERICGDKRRLYDCTFEELQKLRLLDSEERIPLFSDVLAVIGGKVPLVVEIKSDGNWRACTEETAEMLDGYEGIYCLESFRAGVLKWFRKNRPDVIRGQLSLDYFKWHSEQPFIAKLALSDLMLNFLSRPDFISYDHSQANRLSYRLIRRLFPVENVCWTVKSQAELEKARKIFKCFIFDSFIPDEGESE